jgi:hypothetical protein
MTRARSFLRIAFALCLFAVVYFWALSVHAQTQQNGFVPLAPAPASSKLGQLNSSTSLASFLSGLFTAAISLGGILAVLRLAYAGYLYMTSEAFGTKSHAKEVIGDAVLGLLLLLGVWLILKQINPQLLNLNILQSTTGQ